MFQPEQIVTCAIGHLLRALMPIQPHLQKFLDIVVDAKPAQQSERPRTNYTGFSSDCCKYAEVMWLRRCMLRRDVVSGGRLSAEPTTDRPNQRPQLTRIA